jgi:transposase
VGEITSALVLDGGFTTEAFVGFIDKCLVPSLQPGSIIILDNARIHQSSLIRKSLNDAGCELMFQPKYSPDLNPIEHCWGPLKTDIRKAMEADLEGFPKLFEKTTEILRSRQR